MNFKKATVCGILSYCFVYVCSTLTNHSIHMKLFFVDKQMPLWIIIGALIFGIIYVRSLHKYEIFEGFIAGVYFAIISILLDFSYIFFIKHYIPFGVYFTKIAYMYILYPIVITSLGYLANFEVQLN